MKMRNQILETALENGAHLAGIANMDALTSSPSHSIYTRMGDYSGVGTVRDEETLTSHELFNWPDTVQSVLVIGLAHPENEPELDWWDGKGGTPGNRQLIDIMKRTRGDLEQNLSIATHKLHYYVEKGGVFLKDAAVLAGLGRIGKNNMLITPQYGPRLRLRALFLDVAVDPTGPVDFDPCSDCNVPCRKVCPEKAMSAKATMFASITTVVDLPARDGSYDRDLCNRRMEKDMSERETNANGGETPVKYCRKCEFICPVGE